MKNATNHSHCFCLSRRDAAQSFSLLIIFVLLSVSNVVYAQIEPGTIAPDFSLASLIYEQKLSLYDNLLKQTVLYFWTPHSSEMKSDMIKLQDLYSKYDELQVIAILAFPEDTPDALEFVNKNKISFINLIGDRETALKYKVVNVAPAVIVIDKDKKILTAQKSGLTEELISLIISRDFVPIPPKPTPKPPAPEPERPRYPLSLIGWRLSKWISFFGVIGGSASAWHYKKRADFYYDEYLAATDTGEIRRLKQLTKKNDLYWQLSLGGAIGLAGLFIYSWVKEEAVKSEYGSVQLPDNTLSLNFAIVRTQFGVGYNIVDKKWNFGIVQKL